MSERVNPFASVTSPPVFETKPKPERSAEKEIARQVARDNDFTSRQAAKSQAPHRKPRIHRTGRNRQFNAKATSETIDRFYKAADERKVPLGELMKQALDALDSLARLSEIADARKLSVAELLERIVTNLCSAASQTVGGK
jgi:hypothetical protein